MDNATSHHGEGFACRCSDPERSASVERLTWARHLLGMSHGDWFVSGAVRELDLRYDILVVGMYASQWYGLDYRPALSDPENKQSEGRIQCDYLEDGLALLLRSAFDKWGEYRPGSDRSEDPEEGMRWQTPSFPGLPDEQTT
jgi:hypothetical protein